MNDSVQSSMQAGDSTGPPAETVCGCGQTNSGDSEFCSNCGNELNPGKTQEDQSPSVQASPSSELDPMTAEELKFLTLPRVPIKVRSAGITDRGLVKENNEDAFVIRCIEYPFHKITVHVAIVADGMGGEPAGEKFAEIAVNECWLGINFLLPYFEQQSGFQKLDFWRFINNQISNHLTAPIAAANTRVINYGKAKQFKPAQFGCTIVVAILVCDLEAGRTTLYIYNEGDARCAIVIGEELEQLSKDHTMAGNPFRFLGRHQHISGTSFTRDVWLGEAEFQSFTVLLYSDGLWNMLSPQQIISETTTTSDPEQLCRNLLVRALKTETPHGKTLGDEKVQTGDDNVTITAMTIYTEGESR